MKKKSRIVFIICLIVLIAAVASMVGYKVSQNRKAQVYDEMAQMAQTTEPLSETAEEEPEPVAEEEPEPLPDIPIDFASLQEQNPDIYAWISIPDTKVNYPILHSTDGDEDYYLDHTVEHEEGLPGSIYTQFSHNQDFETDPVTVIYGHNMRNETMFGCLKHYQEENFRTEHPDVVIYTPTHIFHYRVAFAVTYDDRHILNTYYDCIDELDYEKFLNSIETERKLPSWLEEPFEVTADDNVIVLSTCNGHSDQRFLIGAVLTDEE